MRSWETDGRPGRPTVEFQQYSRNVTTTSNSYWKNIDSPITCIELTNFMKKMYPKIHNFLFNTNITTRNQHASPPRSTSLPKLNMFNSVDHAEFDFFASVYRGLKTAFSLRVVDSVSDDYNF